MAARSLLRPANRIPNSSEEILDWLKFLCLNSDCRGLGGHELDRSEGLLKLTILNQGATPHERAILLRRTLTDEMGRDEDGGAGLATLHLLGLTPVSKRQPRPLRRRLAANAYGQALDTFQKRYEMPLLQDVAEVLWGLESVARCDTQRSSH